MSAHNYKEVYEDLGINLNTLGCVMLGVETPDTSFIPDDVLYYTNHQERFWIDGRVQDSHLTLKYGLLPQVRREHVDAVLKDTPLPKYVYGIGLMKFDSPYEDDQYDCIVMSIDADPGIGREVLGLHQQLNYLPNISTFPGYKAHVTLAYTRKGWYDEYMEGKMDQANEFYNFTMKTTGLDYGKMQ